MAMNPIIRKVPIIGDEIYKVGQVYDLINMPCAPDAWMWVYAFWHEVPFVFASLFKPDSEDFVQERFGRPHHRKRRHKMRPDRYRPPDINPGKGLGWAAWKMSQWADRLGWYLLIVDTSLTFAINWTSLAYQYNGCAVPGKAYAIGERNGILDFFGGGFWQGLSCPFWQYNIFGDAGESAVLIPPGKTGSMTCHIEFIPKPGSGTNFLTRIRRGSDGRVLAENPSKRVNDRLWAGQAVSPDINGGPLGDILYAEVLITDPGIHLSSKAVITAYGGAKTDGLTWDP